MCEAFLAAGCWLLAAHMVSIPRQSDLNRIWSQYGQGVVEKSETKYAGTSYGYFICLPTSWSKIWLSPTPCFRLHMILSRNSTRQDPRTHCPGKVDHQSSQQPLKAISKITPGFLSLTTCLCFLPSVLLFVSSYSSLIQHLFACTQCLSANLHVD